MFNIIKLKKYNNQKKISFNIFKFRSNFNIKYFYK